MTPDEINKNNLLIAEFMGWKKNPFYDVYERPDGRSFNAGGMLFNCSWDWLMPVVEKIEQGNFGVKLCRKRAEVFYDDSKEVVFSVKLSSRLESTYAAVVEFITLKNNKIIP